MKQRHGVPSILQGAGIILTLCLAILFPVSHVGGWQGQGFSWPANTKVSGTTAVPRDPVVAVGRTGQATIAWWDARSPSEGGIYVVSQAFRDTWSDPIKIPGSDTGPVTAPSITVDKTGHVYLTWISGFPESRSDIQFSWSADGGQTWQPPVRVNVDPGDIAGHPDMVVDAQGNVHVVWSDLGVFGERHSRDIKWSMLPVGGGSWTPPKIVHGDVAVFTEQARPAMTADGAGNVYAIWEDARHGPDDAQAIYAARLPTGSTTWEPGRRVDGRPGAINARPDIAVGPDGTLYAVWDDGDAGNVYAAVLRPGTERWEGLGRLQQADSRAVALESRSRLADVKAGRRGNDGWINSADNAGSPHVAVDGLGVAYVVWQQWQDDDWDIYGAVRRRSDNWWDVIGRVNDDQGMANQTTPVVAVGSAGYVVIAWIDERERAPGDVYVTHAQLPIRILRLPLIAR